MAMRAVTRDLANRLVEKVEIVAGNGESSMTCVTAISTVSLTFKTNRMSATDITTTLGVEPDTFANRGERFRFAYGKTTQTGLMTWSYWSRIFEIERSDEHYDIELRVVEIIEYCKQHKEFIASILHGGGVATVQARLNGSINIGDTFRSATLHGLADLGMSLSIEVFPSERSLG